MTSAIPVVQEADDADGFVERLKQVAALLGSASALAKVAGVSQSGLHRYLTGGEPSRKVLVAIARAAKVSLAWLATGEGTMVEAPRLQKMGTLMRLPLYQQGAAARVPEGQDPRQLRALAFCRRWLAINGLEAAQLAALQVRGNSMEPTISNGDTLLVDLGQRDIVDGDIYVIDDAQATLIRRVQLQIAGKLRLICDNPSYPTTELPAGSVTVVGRVVWRGSLF